MRTLLSALETVLGRKPAPGYLLGMLGKGLGTIGIIAIAIAAAIYLQFVVARYDYITAHAVIRRMTNLLPDTTLQAVEFEYRVGDNVFQRSEKSRAFREFNYAEGDTVELLVDPENYENFLYAEAGPFYKDFALNWSTAGLIALVAGGFLIARAKRTEQEGQG
jgi:hypothetical protein